MTQSEIKVKGARQHNLQNVQLTLPRGELICFSGVSGSGKSSLAFDTLYAEGQRRYVESLSNYARQFMGQMPKPDVDLVSGLSPSISISQKSTGKNPRSTVGTITEIYDFLRVLYARVGTGMCPNCDLPIAAQSRDAIVARIAGSPADQSIWILASVVRGKKGEFKDLFEDLRRQGFGRARVDGETYSLSDPPHLDRSRRHDVEVVVDRIAPGQRDKQRLIDAVELALKLGESSLVLSLTPAGAATTAPVKDDTLLSSRFACPQCGESFRPQTPQLFSFNSTQGMCESCDGLGKLYTFAPEKIIPDESLSFRKGAIVLLGKWADVGRYRRHIYKGVAEAVDVAMQWESGTMLGTAWRDLPETARQIWLWGIDSSPEFPSKGSGKAKPYKGEFAGIIPELLDRYRTTKNKMQLKHLEKHMDTMVCPDCHGGRLNRQASAVTLTTASKKKLTAALEGKRALTLPQVCQLPIDSLADFFADLKLGPTDTIIAAEALKEVRSRIGFLLGVGLEYLNLARTAPTLSGGESQRIRLAGQIGSGLVGVLYILDEPSIGLHPRDNERLIQTLLRLRDAGNTLIVVEHDEETMRAADRVVDFGPGPGVRGGKVVAAGPVETVSKSKKSLTGAFLSGRREIAIPAQTRPIDPDKILTIRGARHHNLKNIDVSFPLGNILCVTGVSGSGKSSLISGILQPALRNTLHAAEDEVGDHDTIEGIDHLDKIIAIDQSPIGRTPRSNPATYVKVFDEIRNLFAKMGDAKTRGYTASRFSFNVEGGRCAACEGNGSTRLEMDFLADIWVTCPVCQGHRYNLETLSVKFKGHSIAEVLEMDIAQALGLFENVPKIATKLQTLVDVGLEYLKLGQPSPTLSGGEAQRIKLAKELSRRDTGRTLYVLDEPTTGLHFADIDLLLGVMNRLADRGNTIVIVEHNTDVIKTADWVIDLGPEGGAGGGTVIAEGRPQDVAKQTDSRTGEALAKAMGIRRKNKPKEPTRSLTPLSADARTHVIVHGAAQHNLRSIDVRIPRDQMTVFCGPSGSGKTSLAMDTIYAEGQRRYVESLSSYARQFIGQAEKPTVDRIEGLSPAVALEQKNLGHSPRSTVGTVTEVYDYLRILMARLGQPHCPDCAIPVGTQTPDQIVDKVLAIKTGTRALLMAPLEVTPGPSSADTWKSLQSMGYTRVRIDGKTLELDAAPALDARKVQHVQVVVDRVTIQEDERSRISDSVEQALSLGVGVMQVAIADKDRPEPRWDVVSHSQHLVCEKCGRSFPELTPHHFSFNSGIGWCSQCEGLGVQTGTDPAALFTAPGMTLADGAAWLWPATDNALSHAMLVALGRHTGVPIDVPVRELTVSQRRVLLRGTGDDWIEVDTDAGIKLRFQFKGFYPTLDYASRLIPGLRAKLERFTDEIDCGACDGSRLREESSAVRFRGMTIGDVVHLPLSRLAEIIRGWKLDAREKKIAGELLREVQSRVQFLNDVGLGYLTLHRPAATLSGGEAQRIRLAAQLGSGLCGVLYVLDEPTIGLHPRDNLRLLAAMHRLRDLGNTLLVVEHDRDVIGGSDYLCDFGPAAGRGGGSIVAQGPPSRVQPEATSVTAGYITGSKEVEIPATRRPVWTDSGTPLTEAIELIGAGENNLRGVDFRLPLGVMTAITGPSGSGKSSLIDGILYPAIARRLHRARLRPGRHESLLGLRYIDKVIRVDQSSLGNSPSSNPATYTGLFDHIRQVFAEVPEAGERRMTSRHFSFNVPGGRCDTCDGYGQLKVEMHFLPDVWVTCDDCHGHRYNDAVLEIRYRGRNIADVLEMSCGEAVEFFSGHGKITHILQTLCDVGLDYVTLGQSAPTLSGGEAQRVKLASELARPDTGRTLYLLDEPTTGLHFDDIRKLLAVMQRLTKLGNTVVVIEHNLDVIKCVDWVIDLGPGAGDEGGQIVFEGTPEAMANTAGSPLASVTAPFLAEALHLPANGKTAAKKTRVKTATQKSVAPVRSKSKRQPAEQTEGNQAVVPDLVAHVGDAEVEVGAGVGVEVEVEVGVEVEVEVEGEGEGEGVWKVLGKKWHTLPKGFEASSPPRWPLELAERVIDMIEDVAGPQSLRFDRPDALTVRAPKSDSAVLVLNTKRADSLRLHLQNMTMDSPVLHELPKNLRAKTEASSEGGIAIPLTKAVDGRSRKLKQFLRVAWAEETTND
ncbi:MAG: excinuclease ABC subunit UvrA [Planctomycetota bacterium]